MRKVQATRSLLQKIVRGRVECKSGRRHNNGIDFEIWLASRHGCLLGSRPGRDLVDFSFLQNNLSVARNIELNPFASRRIGSGVNSYRKYLVDPLITILLIGLRPPKSKQKH